MGNKKKTILPIILMVDDGSSEGFEQFVLAIKKLGKEDISDMEDGKARFEAGLLINPIDYLPGLRRSKANTLTTDLLADEVKELCGR